MLEGYFLFAVLFRVSHMGVLDSGPHCCCPNWTAARKQDIFIYWLFDHAGLKCVPHKITTHPTVKTAPHLRFSNILLAVLEVMSTKNSRLMLSLQQGFSRHFFKVIVSYNSRGWSRGTLLGCSNHWTPTFSPSTSPKVGGRKSRMQPMLLPYVLLPWLLRGEARSLPQRLGMRCGGNPPKVPGCRLEKESPLRIFRTNRWDVEGSLGKILGPRIFLEILGPNWTKQHALRFCWILVRQNAQAIQGPDVNGMWSLAADVGVKFPSAAATPNLGEIP